MKAVVFQQVAQPLILTELTRPEAGPGELVFKVDACGICGSDLHASDTEGLLQAGTVLGHEFCGTVSEVGTGVEGWNIGDRMIALPIRPCGHCPACKDSRFTDCEDMIMQGLDPRLPGAYAEYASCMAALAIRIPDGLTSRDAALVEPLAVGLGAYKSAAVANGADVLIIGAGVIGLAVAKWADFFGAGGIGISDLMPARLQRARDAGVSTVIDASETPDPVVEYERQTGRRPTVIFECVGRPMIDKLIEMAPPGAQLVMVGTGMQAENFTVLSAALKRLRMTFTLGYEAEDFEFVLRALSSGRLSTQSLVSAVIHLDDTVDMFETLRKPNDHCKVLIQP